MKTLSGGMATHVAQEVTTLASCWRVTRTDGQKFYFTSHDLPLDIDLADGDGLNTYVATSAYNRTSMKSDDTLSVDNLDITGVLNSMDIDETELRRGLFNFAEFDVFLVNWENLAQGVIKMRKGWLGEVTITPNGLFTAELRGLMQPLSRRIGELITPECRADLGDARCKIPIDPALIARSTAYVVGDYVKVNTLDPGNPVDDYFDFEDRIYRCTTAGTTDVAQPVYDTTPGNPTTDGTAVFTAEQSWSRAIEVTVVDGSSPRKKFTVTELTPDAAGVTPGRDYFPTDSMNGGVVVWETGANAGRVMEIRDFTGGVASQDIELFLAMPFDITVGDRGRAYRGCLKRLLEDCKAIFDNVVNMRAEPYLPGQDLLLSYPDAKG